MNAAAAGGPVRRATVACLVALAVFALCAVAMRTGLASTFDEAGLHWVREQWTPTLDALSLWLDALGYGVGVLPFDALLVVALTARRRWRLATFAAIALGGGLLLNKGLKLLFERPRPVIECPEAVVPATFSFPSGHAMATATLATVLTALAWRSRWRWPIVLAAWWFALSVAASRLVLGVHFPSDVLAGLAIGIAWASAAWWAIARGRDAATA